MLIESLKVVGGTCIVFVVAVLINLNQVGKLTDYVILRRCISKLLHMEVNMRLSLAVRTHVVWKFASKKGH